MTDRPLVDLLVQADWSVSPKKRWVARAEWSDVWTINAVEPVGPTPVFVADLLGATTDRRVLAGFDFPIGLPSSYGAKTGEADFSAFLRGIGSGRWSRFADIARTTDEISIERPFYPAGSTGGVTQAALIEGHGEAVFDDLRRLCERADRLPPHPVSPGDNEVRPLASVRDLLDAGRRYQNCHAHSAAEVAAGRIALAEFRGECLLEFRPLTVSAGRVLWAVHGDRNWPASSALSEAAEAKCNTLGIPRPDDAVGGCDWTSYRRFSQELEWG